MQLRFRAKIAVGLVLLAFALLAAIWGNAAGLQRLHLAAFLWGGAIGPQVVRIVQVIGWLSFLLGLLTFAPPAWFRWLEKPRSSHRF